MQGSISHPPLGTIPAGYHETRYADGILDPLLETAVAFDDGKTKAVVMSIDIIGFNQVLMNRVRATVAEGVGTDPKAVFVACAHTHLGPCTADASGENHNQEYVDWFVKRLRDVAVLAFQGLALAKLSCCGKGCGRYPPLPHEGRLQPRQSRLAESGNARYVGGTAENLIKASTEIINAL